MSAVMFDTDFLPVLVMPPPDKARFDLADPDQRKRYGDPAAEHLAVKQTALAEVRTTTS